MWVGGRIVYVRGRWVVMVEGELVWSVTMPPVFEHQPLGPQVFGGAKSGRFQRSLFNALKTEGK